MVSKREERTEYIVSYSSALIRVRSIFTSEETARDYVKKVVEEGRENVKLKVITTTVERFGVAV